MARLGEVIVVEIAELGVERIASRALQRLVLVAPVVQRPQPPVPGAAAAAAATAVGEYPLLGYRVDTLHLPLSKTRKSHRPLNSQLSYSDRNVLHLSVSYDYNISRFCVKVVGMDREESATSLRKISPHLCIAQNTPSVR